MTEESNLAAPDLDRLLEQILDLPDTEWRRAVDDACVRHPSVAGALRRRFGCLERTGLATTDDAEWPAPGQRFGAYRLLELLGSGGLGVVYRARRDGIDREVALKVLRPELAFHEVARERFLREASAAARIEHPAVCTLYDFGEHEGMPFLALRCVRGPTLAACIVRARRTARLADLLGAGDEDPVRAVLALFARLADGLEEAHRQDLVHRDVKPENIVLEAPDRPVLIDFGLAHSSEATRLTRSGEPLGTPAYMAPEQVLGRETGPRTDVYALAATLYECVTLRPPFQVAGRDALYRAILEHEVVDPRTVNPEVPRDLAVVLTKAMQKDPAQRYASMRDLGDDLRRIVAREPVRARPVPWPRRLVRYVRRRPRRALAATAAASAVVVLALFSQQVDAAKRAQAEAIAWSTGALQVRDATVGALVAREAWKRLRDSESTRSNLLQALARNLQMDEYPLTSIVVGWKLSPDGAVAVGLSDRVWLRDRTGLRALSGTDPDGQVRIWNCAAWSRDGQRFMVGAFDGSLLLFTRDGTRLPIGEVDFAGSLRAGEITRSVPLIDSTADGEFVVGDREGGLCVLDRSGRQAEYTVVRGGKDARILLVHAGHDTRDVLTVGRTGRVLQWHPPYLQPTVLYGCGVEALTAAVSADGRVLAVGDVTGGIPWVRLDGASPPLHWTPFVRGTEVLALTADGSLLFAAGVDQKWALFRIGSDGPELVVKNRRETNVRCASFDGEGRRVVFGDHAGRLVVLDRLGRKRLEIAGHQDAVVFLESTTEGNIASGGWDGTVRQWRLDVPGVSVIEAHDEAVFRLAWLDDRHLVSSGADGKLALLGVGAGRLDAVPGRASDGRLLFGLAVSADGRRVATARGERPRGVRLWTVDASVSRFEQASGPILTDESVRSLAWSRDGTLVVGANSGRLFCGDPKASSGPLELVRADGDRAHDWQINQVSASPDGRHLASAGHDGAARLWTMEGTWVRDLASGSTPVWSVDFTPQGRRVLLGFADGKVELHDLAASVQPVDFAGARGRVSGARVSPDDRFVAAAAHDGHLHVWTIDGKPWLRLPHNGILHGLDFSPDGEQVAVACSDGTVRIWPVTDARIGALADDVFRELTQEERHTYLGR